MEQGVQALCHVLLRAASTSTPAEQVVDLGRIRAQYGGMLPATATATATATLEASTPAE